MFNSSPQPASEDNLIQENIDLGTPILKPNVAIPFQMNVMQNHFSIELENELGKNSTDEDKAYTWWSERYAKAFRDYCDTHPEMVKHILNNKISDEEINILVKYIKEHKSTDDEIKDGDEEMFTKYGRGEVLH